MPSANETQSFDGISRAVYGMPFDELSQTTRQLVRTVHDRQDCKTKLSKDELARMRYYMSFTYLGEGLQDEITTIYRAQFVGG